MHVLEGRLTEIVKWLEWMKEEMMADDSLKEKQRVGENSERRLEMTAVHLVGQVA